jgi:hypothetical protein
MKQELITLANKKEFISEIIGKSVEHKYTEKDFYYLWLCELQKWLKDKHNIHISIDWNIDLKGNYCFMIDTLDKFCIYDGYKNQNYFNTYEECLEFALEKALNLIN